MTLPSPMKGPFSHAAVQVSRQSPADYSGALAQPFSCSLGTAVLGVGLSLSLLELAWFFAAGEKTGEIKLFSCIM